VAVERDVRVPVRDGTLLVGDIFRPDAPGRFPVILGCHPYNNELQTAPIRPIGYGPHRGFMEAGDPEFFVRRGYVHAVFNVRGTGKSQGFYPLMGPQEVDDVCDLIAWLAAQPWSSGGVGMFGVSYFSWLQQLVASRNPPALKAIFAPYGATDFYRDMFYRGGILGHAFLRHWAFHVDNPRSRGRMRELLGEEGYRRAIAEALRDEDLLGVPAVRAALERPEEEHHRIMVDVLLNPLDGPFYRERNVDYRESWVPAVLGGDWGIYGLHLPGAFRSWREWKGPKKLIVGPPLYLDRPVYQYQYESLRWFDHWLKGVENGVMEEPPIRLFIPPTGEWRAAERWPLPETRWTPFYLHDGGLLSEHELWPHDGHDAFEDSTFAHGGLSYWTPPLVENTEVVGPVVLHLYASSSDRELLLYATLLHRDREGRETELTRGWLRASQRRLLPDCPPWEPVLAHTEREPLEPGRIYELRFPLVPTARLCLAGERIGLRLKSADDEPAADPLQRIARGRLWRQTPVRAVIHHDPEHPSYLLLPITRGNLIGTFLSGGDLPASSPGGEPTGKIDMRKEVL
jgi:predicted acyl esterase